MNLQLFKIPINCIKRGTTFIHKRHQIFEQFKNRKGPKQLISQK